MNLFGRAEGINSAISHLADNVFLLQYHLDGSVQRSFIVVKTRATMHDQRPRPLTIGRGGVELADA